MLNADYLVKEWNAEVELNGKYYVARPINYQCRTFRERIKEAWLVFTGKAEAVVFEESKK